MGLILRFWILVALPLYVADEVASMGAASRYASLMLSGDWRQIPLDRTNYEHPALVKLIYGLGLFAAGNGPWETTTYIARGISAFFGVAAVALLASLNPLAGALLAVHTLGIRFTSVAYLEALPLFTSLGAAVALARSRFRLNKWFWLSTLMLGATAASKYTYAPVAAAILYMLWEQRRPWYHFALYGLAAAAFFLALDPALWPDPAGRLRDTLTYHRGFAQDNFVQESGYAWYQPFVWLAGPSEGFSHRLIYFGFDWGTLALAGLGLPLEWRTRRWVAVWLAVGLLALVWWPAKWPQYPMIILAPLCLAAGDFAYQILSRTQASLTLSNTGADRIRFEASLAPRPNVSPLFSLKAEWGQRTQ